MNKRPSSRTGGRSEAKPPLVPPKLYRIGEITRHTGLSRQTIHNYTAMGLIRESERTPGGHRLYDERVFHVLHRIADLKPTASMHEIRKKIVANSPRPT